MLGVWDRLGFLLLYLPSPIAQQYAWWGCHRWSWSHFRPQGWPTLGTPVSMPSLFRIRQLGIHGHHGNHDPVLFLQCIFMCQGDQTLAWVFHLDWERGDLQLWETSSTDHCLVRFRLTALSNLCIVGRIDCWVCHQRLMDPERDSWISEGSLDLYYCKITK